MLFTYGRFVLVETFVCCIYDILKESSGKQEISINLKNRTLLQDASDLLSFYHVYGCNAARPSGLALTEEELHRSADQST